MSERPMIDLSPAQTLSDDEVKAWAADQRVFISSVIVGMEAERAAVAAAIASVGASPVWFEHFGGRDDDAEAAYLGEVDSSDVYVGVLGERYGRPLQSGYSATHAEYREALEHGLRVSVWVSAGELSGPQRDFVDEVQTFRTTGSFRDSTDLTVGLNARMRTLAAEAMSPWVKVGSAIFRAHRVHHDGSTVRIEARIRDDAVLAYLESMRSNGGRATETRVTWNGRSEAARVTSVDTETSPGRGARIVVVAEQHQSLGRSSVMSDVSFDGRSPEDMTELALRVALFREDNPLGAMSFLASFESPFELVAGLRIPEDATTRVIHLLLTEQLLASNRADRLTRLEVGPAHQGRRRIELGWLPPCRYTGVVPAQRQLAGYVHEI